MGQILEGIGVLDFSRYIAAAYAGEYNRRGNYRPQLKAREMMVDVEYPGVGEVPLPGISMKLSLTPGKIDERPPMLGEHNYEIYCDLVGLSHEEFNELKMRGVV